jgi:futalosine hydrolase
MSVPPILLVVATEAERPAPADARVDVLVCGVGKAAAAARTAERLAARAAAGEPVAAVVSFGVAGAYPASGLALGDVVVAAELAILDEGLETGDRFVPFARPGMDVPGAAWTACDPALVDRLVSAPPPAFRVVAGRVATVSACAGSARLAEERGRHGVLAEGMEGAAVALAAAARGVPFVEVRGISNLCGPREEAPFDLATAVRNAGEVVALLTRPAVPPPAPPPAPPTSPPPSRAEPAPARSPASAKRRR